MKMQKSVHATEPFSPHDPISNKGMSKKYSGNIAILGRRQALALFEI